MDDKSQPSWILALVSDLFFAVAIEDAGRKLHLNTRTLDPNTRDELLGRQAEADRNHHFIDYVARGQPALVIVDLSNADIPWREWIPLIKSTPATKAIPVVCFGSHVNVELMKSARQVGAEAVLARSRFMSALGEVIEKYARRET